MIKQGIINYFKNLKYFFTPLGTLALGLIFGMSAFIPGVISSVSKFSNEVQTILSDTSIDFSALKDSVLSAIRSLDWGDPWGAVRTMTSSEWLMNTLSGCVSSFVESTDVYALQFSAAITAFTSELAAYVSIVIVFLMLGLIGGFFLTKWLVRRNMAKRSLWKYFLHSFVDSILSATLVSLCAWLIAIWKPGALISTIVSISLFGFISLLEAYIVHAWKKVEMKEIVTAKNVFILFATNLIIFLISVVMVSLVTALTNAIVGVFIGIVLMEIAFIVIGLNAEAYVKGVVEGRA